MVGGEMIYFTSDQHYGHESIIKFCHRPFKDVNEMNEKMVERFNQQVRVKDVTYHLGDFAFRNPEVWLPRLNGVHHLILGSHDYKRLVGIRKAGFKSMKDALYLRYAGYRFYLSHYAHRVWRNSLHGSFHLYGHSHGNIPDFNRSMDVGVDVWGFMPITIDFVIDQLKDRPFTNQHEFETGGEE